jgi:hypothetical protein
VLLTPPKNLSLVLLTPLNSFKNFRLFGYLHRQDSLIDGVVDITEKFITGVIDTAEQFIAGVIDTADKHSFLIILAHFQKKLK